VTNNKLGNKSTILLDLKMAARLGHQKAINFLQQKGINFIETPNTQFKAD
jgi:hypothetical protein